MRDGVPLLNGMVIDAELIPALAAYLQRVKLVVGNRDFDNGDVSASNPLPVAVMTPLSVTAANPLSVIADMPLAITASSPLQMTTVVQASDGVWLPVDSLPQAFSYDANGHLITTTATYNGNAYFKTDTWTNGKQTATTGWVLGTAPTVPPSGVAFINANGVTLNWLNASNSIIAWD